MSGSHAIRVVVADDDPEVRGALTELLDEDTRITVVGTVATADAAVAASLDAGAQVAMIDVGMPGGGLNAARDLIQHEVQVVLFTASDEPEVMREASTVGVASVLLKSGGDDLVAAVLAAAGA